MGTSTVTFAKGSTVTINASQEHPITTNPYTIDEYGNVRQMPSVYIKSPLTVNLDAKTYSLAGDSTGVITVPGITCNFGNVPVITTIAFTMTFKTIQTSSGSVGIDPSSVTITFTHFMITSKDNSVIYVTQDMTIKSFNLIYTLNIYGHVYPSDTIAYTYPS